LTFFGVFLHIFSDTKDSRSELSEILSNLGEQSGFGLWNLYKCQSSHKISSSFESSLKVLG